MTTSTATCSSDSRKDHLGIRDRHIIGVDNLLWGSDYPHPESTFPLSQQVLKEILADCTEEERAKIVGGNARRIYPPQLASLAGHIHNHPGCHPGLHRQSPALHHGPVHAGEPPRIPPLIASWHKSARAIDCHVQVRESSQRERKLSDKDYRPGARPG